MKALRIGCICNPDAARNRHHLPRLARELSRLADAIYVETGSCDDYQTILQRELVESLDLLIFSGGDGTMQQGMTALLASGASRFPMLALLPAGATNVAASDLTGCSRLPEAVAALIKCLPQPDTRTRQPLMINPGTGEKSRVGFFFGVGAAPLAVARYQRLRRPVRGMPLLDAGASVLAIGGTAMEIGIRGRRWPQVVAGEVMIDGEATPIESSALLIVTCLDGLFMGASPWWDEGTSPLRYLQLGAGAPALVRNLSGILRGLPSRQVRASRLYAAGGAQEIRVPRVTRFTIDGELFCTTHEPREIRVQACPAIEFVWLGGAK